MTNKTVLANGIIIDHAENRLFDQLGRLVETIGGAFQTNFFTYDANGNLTSSTDGLGNTVSRGYDALNRLTNLISSFPRNILLGGAGFVQAPIRITGFGYDGQDNVTTVTDPRSLITSYVYDGFGHVIQESSPDKGITVYRLDKAGNRTNEVDGRGIITQRTFDKLNRVTAEIFPASSGENITYSYDSTNGGNFGIGRLTGYTDETGSTTLKYNERGDVVSTTRTISGQAYVTSYGYDMADNVTNIVYPSGHVISYARDVLGRIARIDYNNFLTGLAGNISYQPFGPVSSFFYGNLLYQNRRYDHDYRLTGLTTAAGNSSVQNLSYGYDPANNIFSITDNLSSPNSQTFGYDTENQLVSATGYYGSLAYGYDASGNRLSRTVGNVKENYTYSTTANRLQSTVKLGITRSFGYAASGNLTSDSRGTGTNVLFGYGNRNRYNTLTNGSVIATYKYNALGERLVKSVNGATTHYHYDQKGHLIAESQSNGAMIREYVWLNDMPIAQIESSGAIYYIHPDHLGRPQKITDANQNVVWDNELQPFGEGVQNPYLLIFGNNTNRQFQLAVNGLSTYTYVIQQSTNLAANHWVSVATNTSAFTFTDTGTTNNRARFYRVQFLPNTSAVNITNNLRFPGQYYDAESGLNYNLMRDYDPTLGRYIQSDPIGLMGGVNLYGYVDGNPLVRRDTIGLFEIPNLHDTFNAANSILSRSVNGALGTILAPAVTAAGNQFVGSLFGGASASEAASIASYAGLFGLETGAMYFYYGALVAGGEYASYNGTQWLANQYYQGGYDALLDDLASGALSWQDGIGDTVSNYEGGIEDVWSQYEKGFEPQHSTASGNSCQ